MSHAAMSAIVELLGSRHVIAVQRGLDRLDSIADPELHGALAESFQPRAWQRESWQTGRGPLPGPIPWADQVGLAICARAGKLDSVPQILVEGYWELSRCAA